MKGSERGSGRAWVTIILRDRTLDRLRRVRLVAAITAEVLELVPDETPSPLNEAMRGSDARRLHGCLDRLASMQRRAILAAYFDGFTHEELSQRFSAPSER